MEKLKEKDFSLDLFEKIDFSRYVQNYQYFEQNDVISRSKKVVFCPNIRKYQHFEEKQFLLDHFKKSFFLHIFENINRSF